jgi:hypothetical protein
MSQYQDCRKAKIEAKMLQLKWNIVFMHVINDDGDLPFDCTAKPLVLY